MQNISQIIEQAIHSLLQENKEPSVALIKNKLSEPVPMPLIIKALQAWKQTGRLPKIVKEEKPIDLELRITELENQIKILNKRLLLLENK